MQCGAKTRSGEPCKSPAMGSSGRCRMHGGKSLAGLASPRLSHGRYSKVLPARLSARYEEARQDAALLELRDEIGLVDSRLSDLISRVDTGESGAIWQTLKGAYTALLLARASSDTKKMGEALSQIGELITRGHADYAAWDEIAAALEQRRKLVESESRRLNQMQQMITASEAMALVSALLASVREHVKDRDALVRVQNAFIELTTRGPGIIDVTPDE